jgi:two-component system, OmpR family, response regulator ResD
MVMPAARILVADDEPVVREVLSRYLEREGFDVSVAADGSEALECVRRTGPQVVVLDLMLPEVPGLAVLAAIRAGADTRVIILSARSSEADRIEGIQMGADDYVTKPYSPREVVARVHAQLRRLPAEPSLPLEFGGLRIDPWQREVSVDGRPVALTTKEYELLLTLAQEPGRAFRRTELLSSVWGYMWTEASETITVHVRRLREKIEDNPSEPRRLITVRGVGYRFEP